MKGIKILRNLDAVYDAGNPSSLKSTEKLAVFLTARDQTRPVTVACRNSFFILQLSNGAILDRAD